jgi:hypothetical protein
MYGLGYTSSEVLTGNVAVPEDARQFLAEVRKE